MMDWSNEAYVRLYVRNTTTWRRLGFEGQTMLMHMLRVVDRAGVLDIEDMSPAEAATLHTGAPAEFSAVGMAKLLELRTLIHDGQRLVFPRFIEAQETPKSDRQRQKESRERRAVTKRDEPSQNVTECHSSSQSVTLNSAQHSTAEEESPPSARIAEGTIREGSDFMFNATGRFYGTEHRRELVLIASKPAAERARVLARIQSDPWCKSNTAVDPKHVLREWAKYLDPPKLSQPRPSSARFAGPSRVATAAEYAADKLEKAPWES